MTSSNDTPQLFYPLPGRTVDRTAGYETLLRELVELVGAEPAAVSADKPWSRRDWRHRARRAIGALVTRRAKEVPDRGRVPEEWFAPLIRAAVHEPDPSFSRQLVEPAVSAYGRRRVQLALLAYLDSGAAADVAGAARAWYWAQVGLAYVGGTPTPESLAEYEALRDLHERYRFTALRRFVTDEDLDVRRCILPGLPLHPRCYPADMHDLVTRAVQIARTSTDWYLRHRMEIKFGSRP